MAIPENNFQKKKTREKKKKKQEGNSSYRKFKTFFLFFH